MKTDILVIRFDDLTREEAAQAGRLVAQQMADYLIDLGK